MADENRRCYARIKFEADAQLACGGSLYPAELIDLSLRGALLRLTQRIEPGARARLHLRVPALQLYLKFDAELSHRQQEMHGFRFTTMDAETLSQLRRLLELSIGDTVRDQHELEYWQSG